MFRSRNKFYLTAGFILVSAIFIFLRIKTLNHILLWDEARNIIALRAFLSNNTADPLYWNYFFHPPLYMICAGLLAPFKSGLDMRMELLSLLFSYATLVIIYLLSANVGGRLYAFFSVLFLSVMPVSIAHDTWVKRDGLASALGYLAVFLLLKKRFFWCAVALSFSLLAKENAVFFIFAVIAIMFILKEDRVSRKIAALCGVLFVITSWWYLCFSGMPKILFDTYLSIEKNSGMWVRPPWYYFKKLSPDMGPGLALFFAAGVVYLLYMIFRKKQYRLSAPFIVALSVYIPIVFIVACKTPWLSVSAAPALAMIAAGGALFLFKRSMNSKIALTTFALLLALSLSAGFLFSYEKYHNDTYFFGWNEAKSSRGLALYLNERVKDGQAVMITGFSYLTMSVSPVFLYYWKGGPLQVISGRDKAEYIMKEAANRKVSWLAVIDPPDRPFDLQRLVKDLANSPMGEFAVVGWSYVWNAEALWRKNMSSPQIPIQAPA